MQINPSGTRNGPHNSSPMIPAQNITPPPPCWRRKRYGVGVPFGFQTLAHPSGPSRVARASSVKRTCWKSNFIYFCAQESRFSLWITLNGGLGMGLMFFAISFNTLHRACLDLGVTPALVKMAALVLLGFRTISFRIFRRSRSERFLLVPLSFLGLISGDFTNVFSVLASLSNSVAKSLIERPSASPATNLCFSAAVRRPFLGIFRHLQ